MVTSPMPETNMVPRQKYPKHAHRLSIKQTQPIPKSNRKTIPQKHLLVVTSATLLVTGALLVVTRG